MVAAVSTDNSDSISKAPSSRPPLLAASEKDNGSSTIQRKPRGKQVPSRYLSPSPSTNSSSSSGSNSASNTVSKRFGSPLVSKSTNSSVISSRRSQSVDRKRPVGVNTQNVEGKGNVSEMSAASRMLITSTRSLSVSFQGEAFSLPISKAKSVSPFVSRKVSSNTTPERRKSSSTPVRGDHGGGENSRPSDHQHRWPGRRRDGDLSAVERSLGSSLMSVQSLRHSLNVDERRLSSDFGGAKQNYDLNSPGNDCFGSRDGDLTASDSDSVSSGSTNSGMQDFGGSGGMLNGKSGSRGAGIAVSARFWQETNSRLRRLQDPGSPLSSSPNPRMSLSSKSKRFSSDGPVASPRKIGASPIRGATRPASPSKFWTPPASSPSRGMSSPSRVRPMTCNSGVMPSILSFSVDLRRGKMGEERIVDAHTLRLLHNRYLQWRFVNARADATFFIQRLQAEKNLWNAWVTILELRHSVTLKRVKLLLLRQKLKLTSILKGQINFLEEWSLLDREHSMSLEGAIEALKASTLRLPIVGKTIADVQDLKDAVGSAVDVMQAMGSSICLLSSKVEEINSLVAELVNVTAKEKFFLQQCKVFLSTLAAMQVKDCSMRTHILQLNRLPTTSNLTTRV